MVYHFDRNALKVAQITLVVVLGIAYISATLWLIYVGALLLALALGAPQYAPQALIYRVVRRIGLIGSHVVDEDPAPHRFAQQMGFAVLLIASAAAALGWASVAWGATLLVIFLALLNIVLGFCAGCFVHAQIARMRR